MSAVPTWPLYTSCWVGAFSWVAWSLHKFFEMNLKSNSIVLVINFIFHFTFYKKRKNNSCFRMEGQERTRFFIAPHNIHHFKAKKNILAHGTIVRTRKNELELFFSVSSTSSWPNFKWADRCLFAGRTSSSPPSWAHLDSLGFLRRFATGPLCLTINLQPLWMLEWVDVPPRSHLFKIRRDKKREFCPIKDV